jgi:hypothetical protein
MHYGLIDDGTRQPSTPNTADYIYYPNYFATGTYVDVLNMLAMPAGTKTNITIWAYGKIGGASTVSCDLYIDGAWQGLANMGFTTSNSWKSVSYTVNSTGTASQVKLTGYFVAFTDMVVYAMYAVVTYTAGVTLSRGSGYKFNLFNTASRGSGHKWDLIGRYSRSSGFLFDVYGHRFIDPSGDVSNVWARWPSGGTHYSVLDDGIRQPLTPNTTTDYVYSYDPLASEVFDMTTLPGVKKVSEITLCAYGAVQSTSFRPQIRIYIAGTWQSWVTLAFETASSWQIATWTGAWTQADLDALRVEIRTPSPNPDSRHAVYSFYADVVYTGESLTKSRSGGFKWNLGVLLLSRGSGFRFNLLGRVNRGSGFRWNLFPWSRGSGFKFDLRQLRTRGSGYRFNLRELRSRSSGFKWNLWNRITRGSGVMWNVFNTLSRGSGFEWDIVSNMVRRASGFMYQLYGRVSRPSGFKWNIFSTLVSRAAGFKFDILQTKSRGSGFKFDLRALIARGSGFLWNLLLAKSRGSGFKWHIKWFPGFRLYKNDGLGGAIDYTSEHKFVHEADPHTVETDALAAGVQGFGLRRRSELFEENNLSQVVEFELRGSPPELIWPLPNAPTHLKVTPVALGKFRVSWQYNRRGEDGAINHFHIYYDNGTGTVSYTTPYAEVTTLMGGEIATYSYTTGALSDGVTYKFGVRAVESHNDEEMNTNTASAIADATAPDDLSNLLARLVR